MTIRLRPHHLLCLLTYVGKGYSPAFTANYDAIAARMAGREPIVIVDGPDDICRPLLGDPDVHCRRAGVRERDAQAAKDVSALLGHSIVPDAAFVLDAPTLGRLRASFAARTIRSACVGCEWSALCSTVADSEFAGVKVVHVR